MGTPPAASSALGLGAHFNVNNSYFNSVSPSKSTEPKSVEFVLLFAQSPQHRARLPMRVQIFPHDTTDSIITTVKNFYGLYAGPGGAKGVSFENEEGNTLIARYENFINNMVVYVRVVVEDSYGVYGPSPYSSGSPRLQQADNHGDACLAPHPSLALSYGQPESRPTSRTSRKRSASPGQGRGRRSASASVNPSLPTKKSTSRSSFKSRGSSTHGSFQELHSDGLTGYSSGDGGAGSVTSKAKSEHLGNTEISLDNIVEGGRRKRAKFESSVSYSARITVFIYLSIHANYNSIRNSLCLHRHRCPLLLRILQFLRRVAWKSNDRAFLTPGLAKIPSPMHLIYNPPKVIATVSDSLTCIPHQQRKIAEHVEHTRVANLSVHQAIPPVYYLLQIQPLVVVCQRKIRMLLCN